MIVSGPAEWAKRFRVSTPRDLHGRNVVLVLLDRQGTSNDESLKLAAEYAKDKPVLLYGGCPKEDYRRINPELLARTNVVFVQAPTSLGLLIDQLYKLSDEPPA